MTILYLLCIDIDIAVITTTNCGLYSWVMFFHIVFHGDVVHCNCIVHHFSLAF